LSTILKALRRLEEEKAATEEPRPLREQIASTPRAEHRPRRSGWLAAAGALVLGVATGGALIWWLFGNPTPAPIVAAAVTAVPAPQAPAPEPVVPAPPPSAPAAPGPPDQAFASDVELVDRPEALPMVADSEPVQPGPIQPKPGQIRPVSSSAAAERAREAALAEYNAAERARRGLPPEVAPPSPPAPAEPVPLLAAQPAAAQPPLPAPAPQAPAPVASSVAPPEPPAPAPVAQAAPEVAAAQPAAKPAAPKPAAAKPAARRPAAEPAPPPAPAAPEIAVSVAKTQWHPLADRRIAWVRVPGDPEPRRVVEGDVVDGLLIAQIEPSGVVFERDGEKIRRPLGK